MHFTSTATRCLSLPVPVRFAVGELCDKYPQKQGLVLPDFIHTKSRAAIGEIVGWSEQDADAGDPAGSSPTTVSITSADVTRERAGSQFLFRTEQVRP